jgi:hypothetical protein
MPGYGALNDLVNRMDPVELARALNAWLTENSELLPKSLALDGKSIGAKGRLGGIVTLCFHAADQLQGALVTGDALNTQKKRRLLSSATAATTC